MNKVRRIYVEKKEGLDTLASHTLTEIVEVLKIPATNVRVFVRYDIEGLEEKNLETAIKEVFSNPSTDTVYLENLPKLNGYKVFGAEYLTGQYNQRADSASQSLAFLFQIDRPMVRTATIYAISGIDERELEKIKGYMVNLTDSKLAEEEKPLSLAYTSKDHDEIEYIDNFIDMDKESLAIYHKEENFAMSFLDLSFVQDYFISSKRNPTITELKVIDTYWSDHCRHTTFLTELTSIELGDNDDVKAGFALYKELFNDIYKDRKDKYICLMDIATIGAKAIKKMGGLEDIDESDEINACSIKAKVDVDGKQEDWLVMFKNETHNHPTEMEPFGGAATCLGGAIRDPLSGRVFVYQAMRIGGAGNVFEEIEDTIPSKLPQRVISKTAAAGYASYGNQIGVPAGIVNEIYHPNYVAKRMEAGFVIGAAPSTNVRREKPKSGDKIILLGGETGRDGCGGATGSSKAHSVESSETCGAEVQKGNAVLERKILRLFRNPLATKLIKKCNDFGAGGVSVAIGELADGLDIYLDKVPKKYAGLTVTETAISESQERMAVVVDSCDAEEFIKLAREENLMATVVAEVTDKNRMRMFNKGQTVVDLDRSFLDSNGVRQKAEVSVRKLPKKGIFETYGDNVKQALKNKDYQKAITEILQDKNVMIQKGQTEMFDSTAIGGSVLVPFGGKYQLTPSINMAAKIPLIKGNTNTASICSFAFAPHITDNNPYLGSLYAVLASVSKLVAGGADYSKVRLTFQEYFKRLDGNKERFGEPFSALLGALSAQIGLGTPSIGGKDSMSGSFENIDVPNTLISFAVALSPAENIITNVFEKGQKLLHLPLVKEGVPDYEYIRKVFEKVHLEIQNKNIAAATVVENGGVISASIKCAIGNKLGMEFFEMDSSLFDTRLGDLIVAASDIKAFDGIEFSHFATTNDSGIITGKGINLSIEKGIDYLSGHKKVYPTTYKVTGDSPTLLSRKQFEMPAIKLTTAKPRVLIPVFPGTNGEYELIRKFEQNGALTQTLIIQNANSYEIVGSINRLAQAIDNSQIVALAGGAVGGDEPWGSAKFITTLLKNPKVADSLVSLIEKRDGLMLGLGNGFQALIKMGLLPYGKIGGAKEGSPTLTHNAINKFVSTMVNVQVASTSSPWLQGFKVGDIFTLPVANNEGRFYASEAEIEKIVKEGLVATQYVDFENNATMEPAFNPSGSMYAVDGLISPNGRIFGSMSHPERYQKDLFKNIEGNFDMNIFASGIKYYS